MTDVTFYRTQAGAFSLTLKWHPKLSKYVYYEKSTFTWIKRYYIAEQIHIIKSKRQALNT